MTNGSWNDADGNNPPSGPNPSGGYGGQQGGLGQSYSQGQGYQGEPPTQAYQAPAGQFGGAHQAPGEQQHQYGGQPSGGHQAAGHQGGFGGQGHNGPVGHSGEGSPADVFTDFGFRKSVTEKAAPLVFLLTVVWAVLNFLRTMANAWGSQGSGEYKIKNMGTFEALMTTFTALVWLVFVVAVARLLLELCVNVARRRRD